MAAAKSPPRSLRKSLKKTEPGSVPRKGRANTAYHTIKFEGRSNSWVFGFGGLD